MKQGCEYDICAECDLECCSFHPIHDVEDEEEDFDFQYELSKISEERMEYLL